MTRKFWQHACGDMKRDFGALCLRLGVILNGYESSAAPRKPTALEELENPMLQQPQSPGSPWFVRTLGVSEAKRRALRRFCEEMQVGDIVALRRGTAEIVGVGVVRSHCLESDEFRDIDGWHLPLYRQVTWLTDEPKRFPTYALKFGDTTQLLDMESEAATWVQAVAANTELPVEGLGALKLLGSRPVTVGEISNALYDRGVESDSIQALVSQIGDLERLATWYGRAGVDPSEHETVAYLVGPFLRVLGWTPQKMAVEWHGIDVALFSRLPRESKHLDCVVEVKRMNDSCLSAERQALGYAERHSSCGRLILTDGLRYAVHLRDASGGFRLRAYLNLSRLREAYPALECDGAMECVYRMTPGAAVE